MLITTNHAVGYLDVVKKSPWWPSGAVTSVQKTSAWHGFEKPDETIKNPVDSSGYRNPSPWKTTWASGLKNNLSVLLDVNQEFDFGSPYEQSAVGSFATYLQCPSGHASLSKNELRMKILNNLREEILDVAMVLAEMQETASTLGNNLLRVGRSLETVRKKRPKSFHYLMHGKTYDNRRPTDKFLRETAGTFLEWKYGIMPTIYDIEGATAGLDLNRTGGLFDNPPLMVARAQMVRESTFTVDKSANIAALGGSFSKKLTFPVQRFDILKARADFSVNGEGLRGLNRYGIGLGTVATVAFDRTPFTFVLNMALPIADLIKAWTALAGVDVRGYTETAYTSYEVKAGSQTVLGDAGFGPAKTYVSWDKSKGSFFTREAFPRPPMPAPFIRNPIKVSNLSTVLALFTQLRKP